MKRRNAISGQFAVRLIEMLESPAYGALSLSGHKVLSRLEIELAHHGGNDNGKLPVTYQDFVSFGIARECVAPAIRETVALGFVQITHKGRAGNAEFRESSLYRLTYAFARGGKSNPPTHGWRSIKTVEEASEASKRARADQDPAAILRGKRAAQLKKQKPVRKTDTGADTQIRTETGKVPMRKTRTTGPPRKPVLLSISRDGGTDLVQEAPYTLPATDPSFVGPDDLSIPEFLRRSQ